MNLLRQCSQNSPYTAEEFKQLVRVGEFGAALTPGIPLLVHLHRNASLALTPLHMPGVRSSLSPKPAMLDPSAASAYQASVKGASSMPMQNLGPCPAGAMPFIWGANSRGMLTTGEERQVLGPALQSATILPPWLMHMHTSGSGFVNTIPPLPVSKDQVVELERMPAQQWVKRLDANASGKGTATPVATSPPYPLLPASASSSQSASTSQGATGRKQTPGSFFGRLAAKAIGSSNRATKRRKGAGSDGNAESAAASTGSSSAAGGGAAGGAHEMLPLEREMHAELAASWRMHHESRVDWRPACSPQELMLKIQTAQVCSY